MSKEVSRAKQKTTETQMQFDLLFACLHTSYSAGVDDVVIEFGDISSSVEVVAH